MVDMIGIWVPFSPRDPGHDISPWEVGVGKGTSCFRYLVSPECVGLERRGDDPVRDTTPNLHWGSFKYTFELEVTPS